MTFRASRNLGILVLAALAFAELCFAADPVRGEQLYASRCGGCHSLDQNRVGPRHRDVYGRVAGTLPDFTYSPALRASGFVWNDETLGEWLTNPQQLIPGQRMNFRVSDPQERLDIIEFLRSLSLQKTKNNTN